MRRLRRFDEETQALRAQAEIEQRSIQDVARAAVREYVHRRGATAQVDEALHVLIPRYTGLLDRLGNA
ncbi:MAG: ribbon-helix-helix protein, CopG family [Pseudonocardiaceae bacterium]